VSYAGKGPVCLDGIRCTYWITRDRDPVTGELDDMVDIWTKHPPREAVWQAGVVWCFPDPDDTVDFHVGRALATRVKVELGVIPETDLECIRVDGVADIKVTPV
jgi:hypothetical protein